MKNKEVTNPNIHVINILTKALKDGLVDGRRKMVMIVMVVLRLISLLSCSVIVRLKMYLRLCFMRWLICGTGERVSKIALLVNTITRTLKLKLNCLA